MIWQQRKKLNLIKLFIQVYAIFATTGMFLILLVKLNDLWYAPNDNIYRKLYFPVPFDG